MNEEPNHVWNEAESREAICWAPRHHKMSPESAAEQLRYLVYAAGWIGRMDERIRRRYENLRAASTTANLAVENPHYGAGWPLVEAMEEWLGEDQ